MQRASVDGFHRPAAERHAHGRTAETFYRDSYDESAVCREIEAFRCGEPWRAAVFDVEADRAVTSEARVGGPTALLLLDGIFLRRPTLAHLWDASVWLEVPFEVSVPRGNGRFGPVGSDEADPESPANARYVGGQRLYLAEVDPARRATWVLDNTDLAAPVLDPPRATGRWPGDHVPRASRP